MLVEINDAQLAEIEGGLLAGAVVGLVFGVVVGAAMGAVGAAVLGKDIKDGALVGAVAQGIKPTIKGALLPW